MKMLAMMPFHIKGIRLRLRYSHRFNLWRRDARIQLGYRWQDRDYQGITPQLSNSVAMTVIKC